MSHPPPLVAVVVSVAAAATTTATAAVIVSATKGCPAAVASLTTVTRFSDALSNAIIVSKAIPPAINSVAFTTFVFVARVTSAICVLRLGRHAINTV